MDADTLKLPGAIVTFTPDDNGKLFAIVAERGGYPYPLLYELPVGTDPTDEAAVLDHVARTRAFDMHEDDMTDDDIADVRGCLDLHMVLPVAAGVGADFRD